MKRKLNPDELNQLEQMGYNTSSYKGELVEFPDAEPTSTALGAGGRAALANALPATAGAAGFAGGMALAAPFAPATGGLSFLVPIGAGLISGALASGATKYAQDTILPQSVEDRLALDTAEHPIASRAGAIGANLLTMRPSLSVTRDAFKGLAQLPAASVAGSSAIQTLNPVYRNALANVGMGAGISGAVEGGRQLATGELNLGDLATETLVGAALNKPTALGAKVMRLPAHNTGERPIDNPEALRNAQGAVQPPQNDAHIRTFRESLAAQRQFNDAAIGMAEESMANQAKLNAELEATKQSQAEMKAALDNVLGEINFSHERAATPTEQALSEEMAQQKIPTAPSKEYNQAVDDLLQRKNIGVEENRNIPDKGMMRPGSDERKIFVNPEKETVDTRAHEGLHYEIQEIEKDASTGNARAKSFIDSLYSKQSEILAEYNKKLAETGQPPVDAHEFATTEQGARFVQEQLNTKREGPWRKWWNDTKALWNQRFGKNPSVDDLQRALNYRFVNREGMGTVGKFGPLGETGTVRPITAVGKSEEERKSKANPLEGYRKVNVVKADGSREEVYFNDKYYDMGEMGKFASIAKITPEGSLTHGALKKGETIEEIPSERKSEAGRGISRDDQSDWKKYTSVDSNRTLTSLDDGQSGNYWIAPNGDAIPVRGHAEFAEEFQNKPARRMMGDLYDGLYANGWHRVVIGKGDSVYVQAKDKPSNAVIRRLTDVAIANGKTHVIWDNQNGKSQYLYNAENQLEQRSSASGRGLEREDKRSFMTSSERVLRTIKGAQSSEQVLNTLRNKIPPAEWDVLQKGGIESAFANRKVTADEVTKWVQENGPRAEVHSYGMEGKVSEAKKEYDRMTHEWFDNLDPGMQTDVAKILRTGEVPSDLWYETADEQYGKGTSDTVKKYHQAYKDAVATGVDKSPRATQHYSTVSALPTDQPMPDWTVTKSGKNVQRVDVVVPDWTKRREGETIPQLQARLKAGGGTGTAKDTGVLWQPDNLHENLPNTLGWAMIQYKTGPNGEKIALIAEAQSRWGQEQREWMNKARKQAEKEGISLEEILKRPGYKSHENAASSHPLLKDYNRLILKAAIEQARKEGATHIAISDAETAMMTEGHDAQAHPMTHKGNIGKWYKVEANGEPVKHEQWYKTQAEAEQKLENWQSVKQVTEYDTEPHPKQEPGMRLNYDTILPKIAEELTGSKGERVSFGEHKNALLQNRGDVREDLAFPHQDRTTAELIVENNPQYEIRELVPRDDKFVDVVTKQRKLRDNLIFRNPDGTPKTDVSGMMFSLDKAKGVEEPFSYFEKRSSKEGVGLSRTEGETADNSWKSFIPAMASTFDKVERVSKPHAEAARRYEARKDNYTGKGNVALQALERYGRNDVNRVMQQHREAYRNGTEPVLTGKDDKAISSILSNYYGSIADARRELGIRINNREAGKNEYYVPDMMNAETLDLFINHPQSPEALAAKEAWAEHVSSQSEGELTIDKVRQDINEYIEALKGQKNNYRSLEFGAIRRAAGYGLPESMRDTDAINTLARYSRRAAADLAFFQEIQSKPEIAGPLHIKNQFGEVYPGYKDSTLSQTDEIQNMMQWITGNVSGKLQKQPKINALVRLVNNSLLGSATGVRDLVSVPTHALPYISRLSDIKAVWDGLLDVRKNAVDSLAYAAKQPSVDRVQFNDVLDAPDRVSTVLNKAADLMRKAQGREALENFSRDVTFSIGKELGRNNILAAKAGDKKALSWLEKFGTLIDEDVTKLQGEELEKVLNQIGKNFTDRNQGTYGGRGLPLGVVDSSFAPFLSLQKWSIEKANTIYKDVYKPFITGENRLPMLTYTLGSIMTGAAIQELNELMSNRKPNDPTVKEALDKGDAASIATEMATLMQLGSYAGIVSDGLKMLTDTTIRGKTPRNIVSFPTASAAVRTEEAVTNMLEAIRQGENPWDVLKAFTLDMAVNNVQTARLVANRTWKGEDVERSDKFRDMRIFGELEGKPAKDFTPTNPYLGLKQKKFKRTGDIAEAARLAPELVKDAVSGAESSGELKSSLRGLKANSYQTFPSPEEKPEEFLKYYNYLIRTQGKKNADERLMDYFRQRSVNKVKSEMIL